MSNARPAWEVARYPGSGLTGEEVSENLLAAIRTQEFFIIEQFQKVYHICAGGTAEAELLAPLKII